MLLSEYHAPWWPGQDRSQTSTNVFIDSASMRELVMQEKQQQPWGGGY